MFNQISFDLLMHLSITNSSSNTHHIGDICRHICRKIEINMWAFGVFSLLELWNMKLSISISFGFYYHIHALIIFSILALSQKSAGLLTMAKRACKTPKSRSTSFQTASWCWENKTAFDPCGTGIDWIKVAHFGIRQQRQPRNHRPRHE